MNPETFINEISHFLEALYAERNVSKHTLRAYQADLEQIGNFWRIIVDNEPSAPITLSMALERYFIALYQKKISKTSIARKISCFKSFERYLKRTLDIKLALSLTRPRIDKKLPTILTVDEVFFILDKAPITHEHTQFPYRDKSILEMLYATGIRCSELVTIQLQDIDFFELTIRIHGKGKKERFVLFGNECKKKLDLYIQHERMPPRTRSEFLFLNYKNEQLTTRSIQRICELFSTFLASGKQITPHVLRHSFATHMLQQGADLKSVQELLGHATLASTERYTHLSIEDLSALCDKRHPLVIKKNSFMP